MSVNLSKAPPPITFNPMTVCDDCAMILANGTLGMGDDHADHRHACLIGEYWGDTLLVLDHEDEGHFSHSMCDGCGTYLAGTRHGAWWEES